MKIKEIKNELRIGQWSWPGGYPKYFITEDGAALSYKAVYDNFNLVCQEHLTDNCTGWRLASVDINWEDENLFCEQTNEKIQSAYGEE
tara:strand:- start:729 stop:992 length:264 start_codon:yes stop_codon:yes gene_type:complete